VLYSWYWIVTLVTLAAFLVLTPETPSAFILVLAFLLKLGTGISYAILWAMLPEVVDVDEVVSGQHQEGVYAGIMTFLWCAYFSPFCFSHTHGWQI